MESNQSFFNPASKRESHVSEQDFFFDISCFPYGIRIVNISSYLDLFHSKELMLKDIKSLGNNKAPTCKVGALCVNERRYHDTPSFIYGGH